MTAPAKPYLLRQTMNFACKQSNVYSRSTEERLGAVLLAASGGPGTWNRLCPSCSDPVESQRPYRTRAAAAEALWAHWVAEHRGRA